MLVAYGSMDDNVGPPLWHVHHITLCTDAHGPQRMNCTDFGDPWMFPLEPLTIFCCLSNTLVLITTKIITLVIRYNQLLLA